MLGKEYVIRHITDEYVKKMEERLYRAYISDALKCLAESWGAQIDRRYVELIEPPEDEEEISGDEVALKVIEKCGLKTHGN